MERKKKEYPLDGKTMFGLSTYGLTQVLANSFMSSYFMLFLTDYSRMKPEIAAAAATVILMIGRLIDAVDDPLQGYIMDHAKPTKIGKFKPFMFLGIGITTLAIIFLYNLPAFDSAWMQIAWVSVFYILFEIGFSFQPVTPVKYSLSNDDRVRAEFYGLPRIIEIIAVVPVAMFTSVVIVLSGSGIDISLVFGVCVAVFMGGIALLSLLGTGCIKEGPYTSEEIQESSLWGILKQIVKNRAMLVTAVSIFVSGFAYCFITGSMTYYIKWAFGTEMFPIYSAIAGLATIFAAMLGIFLSSLFFKNISPVKGYVITLFATAGVLLIMFVLHLAGVLGAPLFLILLTLAITFESTGYVPKQVLWLEAIDYGRYCSGDTLAGIVSSIQNFVSKAQGALATVVTGAVLIAVGYVVNEADEYVGTKPIDDLLSGLMVVLGVLPAVVAVAGALIMKFYPVDDTVREEMKRLTRKNSAVK